MLETAQWLRTRAAHLEAPNLVPSTVLDSLQFSVTLDSGVLMSFPSLCKYHPNPTQIHK